MTPRLPVLRLLSLEPPAARTNRDPRGPDLDPGVLPELRGGISTPVRMTVVRTRKMGALQRQPPEVQGTNSGPMPAGFRPAAARRGADPPLVRNGYVIAFIFLLPSPAPSWAVSLLHRVWFLCCRRQNVLPTSLFAAEGETGDPPLGGDSSVPGWPQRATARHPPPISSTPRFAALLRRKGRPGPPRRFAASSPKVETNATKLHHPNGRLHPAIGAFPWDSSSIDLALSYFSFPLSARHHHRFNSAFVGVVLVGLGFCLFWGGFLVPPRWTRAPGSQRAEPSGEKLRPVCRQRGRAREQRPRRPHSKRRNVFRPKRARKNFSFFPARVLCAASATTSKTPLLESAWVGRMERKTIPLGFVEAFAGAISPLAVSEHDSKRRERGPRSVSELTAFASGHLPISEPPPTGAARECRRENAVSNERTGRAFDVLAGKTQPLSKKVITFHVKRTPCCDYCGCAARPGGEGNETILFLTLKKPRSRYAEMRSVLRPETLCRQWQRGWLPLGAGRFGGPLGYSARGRRVAGGLPVAPCVLCVSRFELRRPHLRRRTRVGPATRMPCRPAL